MNNHPERIGSTEEKEHSRILENEGGKERERLREQLEQRGEQSQEQNVEAARQEALEKETSHELEDHSTEQEQAPSSAERRMGPPTKLERETSFTATMNEVRSQLSAPSRTFSKVIHNPTVEKISEVTGNTVARPNAILSGAIFAFALTLAVYLVAKNIGYPLSGFETIGAFILGWIIGLVYDFLKVMITGRK